MKALLRELFQLDQPDLDFGLYRVLHAKSAEVTQFLDVELLPQVHEFFRHYRKADKSEQEKELAQLIKTLDAAGVDPELSPKVGELRAALKSAVDVAVLEREVYEHLYSFFRRYYAEGDFLAKRVYKQGVYAIPYEGEEVTLHWANKDQYYVKTAEYLRDYAFRLRPDSAERPMRVHFRLVDASEGEHGNVKTAAGKERRFRLADTNVASIEGGELVLRFSYQPAVEKQKELNSDAEAAILGLTDPAFADWLAELKRPHVRSDGSTSDSRLRVHLERYSARNTFDYFIHKDLGGFLRRELDFYIKNEVMHLDDIENESAERVEQYLSKIKVVRKIAGKIITFLAQLEDFQKKLWLKKKFVVETRYCIALGSIPSSFHAEIASNSAQIAEWCQLHAIDELQGDLATPGYSTPLSVAFLQAHPTLMLDTQHFRAAFNASLLEALGDLEAICDGVLFHSENFQALSLMQARYREQVKCIYIDPPYNTGNDGFAYKDSYQRSSWSAMFDNRVSVAATLSSNDGLFFSSIDDNEITNLRLILSNIFGANAFEAQIVVQSNKRGQTYQSIAKTHEYLLAFSAGDCSEVGELKKEIKSGSENDSLGPYELWELRNRNPKFGKHNRPNLFYPIFADPNATDSNGHCSVSLIESSEFSIKILPLNSVGSESCWRWSKETLSLEIHGGNTFVVLAKVRKDGGWNVYQKSRKTSTKAKTIWDENDVISEQGTVQIGHLGFDEFAFPKPVGLLAKIIEIGCPETKAILDFFAGSGTTAHAVINLNREDDGQRKFILVEMGDHFHTVLLPRIKKVTFTPDWKDGKPKRLASAEEAARSPRVVKIVRLESYEDALNNLVTERSDAQRDLLAMPEAAGSDGLKEHYLLRYLLDVETRGSQSLLNVADFRDPAAYQLSVKRAGSDESCVTAVDLLETFNWLIGLHVQRLSAPQRFDAHFERDSEGRLRLQGRLLPAADGRYWFRSVTGKLADGRKALVIWRRHFDAPEQDNLVLDAWFTKQGYCSKDFEFDVIYVNGGNNLENLKAADDTWKVRLIEQDFHRLMFADAAQ